MELPFKKINKIVLLMAVLLILQFPARSQTSIENYTKYFALTKYQNKDQLVIRKFKRAGTRSYLVVDPEALTTAIVNNKDLSLKELSWEQALSYLKTTTYAKTIAAVAQLSGNLQDAGIIDGFPKEKGVTLTIDLCPSHKPLDRIIFSSLITEFQKVEKPVPLAISITGRWMLTHEADLDWLKGLVASGDIVITWIDHSYNHRVSAKAPLQTNFLLEPGTDLNFEILGTELAMLQKGLVPSVFFRFPGLVSDAQVVGKVLTYGIIPVGSDAWLAKGQATHAGSIVLIHGNGNEPVGVKDFIKLLQSKKADIERKHWLLYDLSESVEDEFSQ